MAKRDPFGPVTTNADYYLPPEYYSVAQPAYPTNATHEIVQGYSAGLVGLYTGFATVATKKAPQTDLNKKGEWVDSLGPGIGIIVFREACGYKGQWSEVIVIGNRYHTDAQIGPNIIEKKKLYLRSDALRSLTIESHPIVDESDIVSPTNATIPSNWRSKVLEKPYFDNRAASYCIVVEYRIDNPGSQSDIQGFMTDSLADGIEMIFDYYNKDGPESGPFFIFARATEYHVESRPADYNSSIKVLVQIPQIYFDTYEDKGVSLGSQISQGLSDAEESVNRYLDSNNGMANTQALRDGFFSGLDDDALRSEARGGQIFGEEVDWVQKDWARNLLTDPNDSAARSQENIDAIGDAINGLPEHLYNRFIPGEWRDAIAGTTADVKAGFAAATEFSDDLTKGLDDASKILNRITTSLENAPDFASVNDSLASAFTNPNVDLLNLTSVVTNGALGEAADRRRAAQRDIASVLPKFEGTLIKQKYDSLLSQTLEAIRNDPRSQDTIEDLDEEDFANFSAIDAEIENLEETIKRIDFYSSFTPQELSDGITSLLAILKNYEKEKDSFQGDVNGWRPKYDADRVELILLKINDYLSNTVPEFVGDSGEGGTGTLAHPVKYEFGFSKNHKLIYIGFVQAESVNYAYGTPVFFGQETFHFHGDSSLGAHINGTPPLDSETIMAYLWKLNDSTKEGNLKLTQWGSKYVFPRPTFVYKPKLTSDVTEEVKRLKGEILTLQKTEEQKNAFQNTELRLRQGIQAVNHLEQKVDSYAADLNNGVDKINNADDVFFDWLAAASSEMNPYVAGLIKCVTPKIDIDLLPEIPDIDLSIIRNPVMKFIELTDAIIPSDPNWQLKVAAEKAWEQAKKLVWVTAVKMLLEYYAAACLQLQAFAIGELLDAVDDLMNPDPDDVDLDSAGGAQTRQALEDSSLLNSLRDSNLLPLDGLNDSESIEKIRALFSDVTGLLSPVEICQLTSGLAPPYVVELVRSLISIKHPFFVGVLDSRSKIQDLFISIGDMVNHNLCDEIISNHENETYNTSYGGLACDISKELAEVRRSLLQCQPGLTPEMIEDIIARENENTLRTLRTVLENLGSDKTIPPLDIETDATKHAKKMAFKSLFSPAERSLNKELKEYAQYMRKIAESHVDPHPSPEALEILHSKTIIDDVETWIFATAAEVMLGARDKEELPFATEIATFFRTQLKTIESNQEFEDGIKFNVFDVEEGDGIKIKLRSLGQSITTGEQIIDIATRTGWLWPNHHKPYDESEDWGTFDDHAQSYFDEVVEPNLPYELAAQEHLMKHWREEGFEAHMNCREYEDNDNQYYQTGIWNGIPEEEGGNFGFFHDNGSWNDAKLIHSGKPGAAQKMPSDITDWNIAKRWLEDTIKEQSADFKKNVKEEEGDKIRIHDMTYAYRKPVYEVTKALAPDTSTFELSYNMHNTATDALGDLFSGIGSAIHSLNTGESTPEVNKKGNYSLTIKDMTSLKDKFVFSSNIETSDDIQNYLQEAFPDVTLESLVLETAAPQQIYFEKFMNPENDEEFGTFLKSEVFTQVTKDIIADLGRKIAGSKYFSFSDEEESGNKISNLEALHLEDKSLFNLDTTLDQAVDKYIKNKGKDLPPPRDATVQRVNYNAFEVAGIEQSIKSMVRVYVIEYFVKGLFVTSSFKSIGEAKDLAKDYLLEKIKSDIPKLFNKIFDYKFFYLARGIYQDGLESGLTEVDHDFDYIFKKHIAEQYDIVSKQWDEMLFPEIIPEEISESATTINFLQPMRVVDAMVAEEPIQKSTTLSPAALEYLNQLPMFDVYETPTFFAWTDGQADFSDASETKINGNFYYEKFIKITDDSGSWEKRPYNDFKEEWDRVLALKPSASENFIEWMGHQRTLLEYIDGIKRNFEIMMVDHLPFDEGWHLHLTTLLTPLIIPGIGSGIQNEIIALRDSAWGMIKTFHQIQNHPNNPTTFEGWSEQLDEVGRKVERHLSDVAFSSVLDVFSALSTRTTLGGTINTGAIASISYGVELRYMLPKSLNPGTLSIRELLERMKIIQGRTDEEGIPENADSLMSIPIMTEIEQFTSLVFSQRGQMSEFLNSDPTPAYNNLKQKIFAKPEMKFLFDYVFPVEKYKTLMSIYTIESMTEFPGLDSMFAETKTELRTVFNKMDSRGRFNYKEPDRVRKLGEIQEAKNRPILPLRLANTSEQVMVNEEGIERISAPPSPALGSDPDTYEE